jgi:hypothetical protein
MSGTIQTLKSSNHIRVDQGKAHHLAAARFNLGEPLLCAASAQNLQHDIYGRPASQNTLTVNLDASCGQLSQYPASRHIAIENQTRPYLPICTAGLRGAGDLAGYGRDLMPQDLYGEGNRGNFVRHYSTANNSPYEWEKNASPPQYYSHRKEQPFTFSHDASKTAYFSG